MSSSNVKLLAMPQTRCKPSILGFAVNHESPEISYLFAVDCVRPLGRGWGGVMQKEVFHSWSRQLGGRRALLSWWRWDGWDSGWSAGRLEEGRGQRWGGGGLCGENGGEVLWEPRGLVHWSRYVSFKVSISPIWLILTLPDFYLCLLMFEAWP